jgi:P-type E1-E2 ATPase
VLPTETGAHAETELLALAGALEAGESHPVAAAVLGELQTRGIAAGTRITSEYIAGQGVRGDVDGRIALAGNERLLAENGLEPDRALARQVAEERSAGRIAIWVARGDAVLGALVLEDPVRPEAADAVSRLARRGVDVAVVSGDAQATVDSVAARLHVERAFGDIMPHDKERVVRELADEIARAVGAEKRPPTLAFVGDGINDAAALAAADLAVTVAGASDVAQLAADAVLLDAERPLAALPALVDLSRATRQIVFQNLAWAFAYNAVTIPLAVAGLLSPIAAAIAMALSSLAVVANSWRLRFAGARG